MDTTYRRPTIADAVQLAGRAAYHFAVAAELQRRGDFEFGDRGGLGWLHFSLGSGLQMEAGQVLTLALSGRYHEPTAFPWDDPEAPVRLVYSPHGPAGPSPADVRESARLMGMACGSLEALVDVYAEWRDRPAPDWAFEPEPDADPDDQHAEIQRALGATSPGVVVHRPADPVMDDTDTMPDRWAEDDEDPDADGAGVSFDPRSAVTDEGSNA